MDGWTSFMSCRFAPSITTPIGTPCPSVSMLRFTPHLPRLVGLGPVFPRPKGLWSWLHPSQASPNRFHIAPQTARHPLTRRSGKHLLPPIPGTEPCAGQGCTQVCLIERLPLAARAEYTENGVRTTPIRNVWTSPLARAEEARGDQVPASRATTGANCSICMLP